MTKLNREATFQNVMDTLLSASTLSGGWAKYRYKVTQQSMFKKFLTNKITVFDFVNDMEISPTLTANAFILLRDFFFFLGNHCPTSFANT